MDPSTSNAEQVKIHGNSRLSDRMNAFQQNIVKKQSKFSHGTAQPKGIPGKVLGAALHNDPQQGQQTSSVNIHDPNYGRPMEGSKSDKRGKAAAVRIGNEIHQLCSIIKEYGKEVFDPDDPTNGPYYMITFKELFDMYTVISNKVVGCLLRARKHGLVDFEGEMLFQRRDDNVIITLIVDPSLIQADQDSTSCVKTQ